MDQIRLILLAFVVGLVSADSHVSSLFREQCPKFRIKKSTIIKTQKSIHDGAEFLGKRVMSSSRGCHEQCCKKEGCNMVMLKYDVESSTEKVSCFMFNCRSPSVCAFYQHSSYHSYAALEYEDRKPSQVSRDKDYYKDGHKAKMTTTTEAPYTTTKAPKVYKPDKAKHWEHINWFDATTTTTPKYMKPKYNGGFGSTKSRTSEKDWLDDQEETPSTTHRSYKTSDNTHVKSWEGRKASKKTWKPDDTKYGSYDHTQNTEMDKRPASRRPEVVTSKPTTEEEEFPRRVFVDNNPDFPEEPKGHVILKTPTVVIEKPTKPRVSNVVIRRLNIQENKAVIPLAVGLVLALLLLMAIIFRLKTSRRRRTKAFLTDDADYLINGMYL